MSANNNYNKLLLVSTLLGMIGSLGVILGLIIGVGFSTLDVISLSILAIVAGIFVICLLTFLGALTPSGLVINDERPTLFSIGIFMFFPTLPMLGVSSPMYALIFLQDALFLNSPIGYYLTYFGIGLLFIAFLFAFWTYFWKERYSNTGGLNLSGSSEIGFVKLLRIITSIFVMVGGIGVILGIALPISSGDNSLLMPGDFDLGALALLILVSCIILTALFVLLSNFGILKISKSGLPILVLIVLFGAFPGYSLGLSAGFWSSPLYELAAFLTLAFGLGAEIAMTWVTAFGIVAIILGFFIGMAAFFFTKTATQTGKVARVSKPKTGKKPKASRSGLEARKKKGKFPTGPPSAVPSSSGPPTGSMPTTTGAMAGPPSGQQPTVSSAPPTPPSFMPTTGSQSTGIPAASENPTCPFCGKQLRFIDEYKRWYCDSCSQYV